MNRSSTEGEIARSDVGVIGRKGRDKSLRNAGNSYLLGLSFGLVVKICIFLGAFWRWGFGDRDWNCLVVWLVGWLVG